jgi:hypothetical protein
MRIRLCLSNVRFQFLFFAGMGNGLETHVTAYAVFFEDSITVAKLCDRRENTS